MHDVMKKTYEFLDCLDQSDIIKNLEIYKNKIEKNLEIKKLIQLGNCTKDKYELLDIKNQLYKFDDYQGYISSYNELMYLVMDINSRYKKLIGKGRCFK